MQTHPPAPEVKLPSFANSVEGLALEMRLPPTSHFRPIDAISQLYSMTISLQDRKSSPYGSHYDVKDVVSESGSRVRIEEVASLLSAKPEELTELRTRYFHGESAQNFDNFISRVFALPNDQKRTMMTDAVHNEAEELRKKIDAWTNAQTEGNPSMTNARFQDAITSFQSRLGIITGYLDKITSRVSNPIPPEAPPLA